MEAQIIQIAGEDPPKHSERVKLFIADMKAVCEKHKLGLELSVSEWGSVLVNDLSATSDYFWEWIEDETLIQETADGSGPPACPNPE